MGALEGIFSSGKRMANGTSSPWLGIRLSTQDRMKCTNHLKRIHSAFRLHLISARQVGHRLRSNGARVFEQFGLRRHNRRINRHPTSVLTVNVVECRCRDALISRPASEARQAGPKAGHRSARPDQNWGVAAATPYHVQGFKARMLSENSPIETDRR